MNQATGLTTTVVTHVLFVEQVKFLSFLVPYAGRFAGTTGWNGVAVETTPGGWGTTPDRLAPPGG